MHESIVVRTAGVTAFRDFADEWQARMGRSFRLAPFSPETVAGFRARTQGFRLKDVMYNDFQTDAAVRTAGGHAGRDDCVRLWMVSRGTWRVGEPRGTEHTVPAGRLLVQTGRLTHFAATAGARIRILVLPAGSLPRPSRRPSAGPAGTAEVRLLTTYAGMVGRVLGDLGPDGAGAARTALVELARAAVTGRFDDAESRSAPLLAQAARELADRRLTEPDLGAPMLAGELNVSVRTLQRAFAADGQAIGAYIRDRRLDAARRALTAPDRRMTISEIAARWQFADSGHFARAFRRRYGHRPSDDGPAPR
ncbi:MULTISPECIES: helix-turn-helix domain-containing protein [Catenuloplanes]|uniref:AraC-like DNA-binding protein n=1 Tax=Catenuloplanes niger TaxID=587534 RepID=A0AAE4CT90_9ACTN|nr:helix-turn-helix domain-containing protein [Catenuloplanes niger]MDR7320489.1 AraC-like DNA-binding protein [Catenuloplanes niger]